MGAGESSSSAESADVPLTSPSSWSPAQFDTLDESVLFRPVPESFSFSMEESIAEAQALLTSERISELRYELVPSQLTETEFWRALFYFAETARSSSAAAPLTVGPATTAHDVAQLPNAAAQRRGSRDSNGDGTIARDRTVATDS